MKNTALFLFGLLIISTCGCKEEACFKTAGDKGTREWITEPFNQLTVHDYIDIRLHQSADYRAVAEGGANLLSHVSVEVEEGVLTVKNSNTCRWLRDPNERVQVDVFTPDLRKVNYLGYGDFSAMDLKVEKLEVYSFRSLRDFSLNIEADSLIFILEKGAPNLYLEGVVDYFYIYHFGTGLVFAEDLKVESKIHLNHESTGDFHVHPMGELFLEIFASGNIYSYHEPEKLHIVQHGPGQYFPRY